MNTVKAYNKDKVVDEFTRPSALWPTTFPKSCY